MKADIIPELFFDIVGRVVPGTILVLATVIVVRGPKDGVSVLISVAADMNIWLLFGSLIGSYVLGVALNETYGAVSRLIQRTPLKKLDLGATLEQVKSHTGHCERIQAGSGLQFRAEDFDSGIALNHLRLVRPPQVARLLKIQAEMSLSGAMVVTSSVLLVAWSLTSYSDPRELFYVLAGLLFALWSFSMWRRTLHRIFQQGVLTLWYIHNWSERPRETK